MRCQTHCPAPVASLRGPLLALGALAAVSLGVYVASLLEGFLVALLVAVAVLDAAGIALWVRLVRPRKARVIRAPSAIPQTILQNEKAPLAVPAARPAVQGVVLAEDVESRLPA